MRRHTLIRADSARAVAASLLAGLLFVTAARSCCAQSGQSALVSNQATPSEAPMVLDRAVAVVNRHVILASDLDEEIRLSVLDANGAAQQNLARQQALDQLISRTLIEQQIRQEDMPTIEPSQEEIGSRLHEIRTELPVCVRQNCASDAGWKAFLTAHALTEQRVDAYLRYRLEILSFIEERFRQG
ncbi:MAG: SurA N-terminal domain-containing protein, partial [Terracidiphilus sp.]